MTTPGRRSDHPADVLIRELIDARREASAAEIDAIVERMATAPFNPEMVWVPLALRGRVFRGNALGADEPSLRYHLYLRTVANEQWSIATTEEQYLADLHGAAGGRGSRVGLGVARGGAVAIALAGTATTVPGWRLGRRSEPNLLVVYSADRGTLVTGYQYSSPDAIRLPGGTLWLNRT